ncbi:hypothetical protein RJ641_022413, partial [Dillenia turbinata]
MKHLLRKLHIGGGNLNDQNHRLSEPTPPPSSSSSSSSSSSTTSSSTMTSRPRNGDVIGVSPSPAISTETTSSSSVDYGFLEEEFQVQLALAISASDPHVIRDDPESVQINAAKQLSLACSPSVFPSETLPDYLSLRYWNYNFVNYDEKVSDGFYDVYGVSSNAIVQGKMPLLVDLQAISVLDNVDYEVVSVNRLLDLELQQLEERAYCISTGCKVSEHGPILSGLVQKIADLVVARMGGPVGDADEMLKRWTIRSYELRNSLNSIILPLGCLDVGLSRHRALLFKLGQKTSQTTPTGVLGRGQVLADRINLPCRLVKGSCYTGTDEGAVNLIKIDDGSEFIIDLMGAPGTLIPAEFPSCQSENSGLDLWSPSNNSQTSCMALDRGTGTESLPINCDGLLSIGTPGLDNTFSEVTIPIEDESSIVEKNRVECFEHEFGKLLPLQPRSQGTSFETSREASPAQKMKIKDVSKYVISAAKNPEFAQKLHAVLLESGASPPPDLFSDIRPNSIKEKKVIELLCLTGEEKVVDGSQCHAGLSSSESEQSLALPMQVLPPNIVDYNKQGYYVEGASEQSQSELYVMKPDCSFPLQTTREGYVLVNGGLGGTDLPEAR